MALMNDLVTVYIPTKNRVTILKRAVASVLSQTYRNLELIVVSDGSTDATCDFVSSISSDISIKLIANINSEGASAARNQAIKAATGKFVTGLDDDDLFMPNRIECFLNEWRRLEVEGIEVSCLFDRYIVNYSDRVALWGTSPTVNLDKLLSSNAIGNQIFVPRERLIDVGGFDVEMPAWQDWETWVRVVSRYGTARNIASNSYLMDVSHEFERISLKKADKIVSAARLFDLRYCQKRHRVGLLRALGDYPQVSLSLNDVLRLIFSKHYRFGLGRLYRRRFGFWSSKIF